jgi:heat shock protein HslJ
MSKTRRILIPILAAMAVIALAGLVGGCGSRGNPLAGTKWEAQDYFNPANLGGMATVLSGTTLTAEFGDDDQLNGSGGCNNYFGGYSVSGDLLTVSQLGVTMMACPDPEGIMEQEYAFLGALQSAAGYKFEGSQLHILDGTGQVVIVFNPQ